MNASRPSRVLRSVIMRLNPQCSQLCGTWIATVAIVLLVGVIDWETGYELDLFAFYFIAVSLAAWRIGFGASVVTSVLCALVWFAANYFAGKTHESHIFAVWNTTIHLCAFLLIAWLTNRIRGMSVDANARTEAYRKARAEIDVLEGMLPICAQCKKIRNSEGSWEQIEAYIGKRSNVSFTHGYCPDCARRALRDAGLDEGSLNATRPPEAGGTKSTT